MISFGYGQPMSYYLQLYHAIESENENAIKRLLNHVNVLQNLTHAGECLMIAAHKGQDSIIKIFTESPFFLRIPSDLRATALRYATQSNQSKTFALLLKANADANIVHQNPACQCLMLAVLDGYHSIATLILKLRANDINFTQKKSALKLAMRFNHAHMIDLLSRHIEPEVGKIKLQLIIEDLRELIRREDEAMVEPMTYAEQPTGEAEHSQKLSNSW